MTKLPCTTKKKYGTFQHARYDAREIMRKHDEPIVPYKCRACGHYHVGEPMNREEGRKRRDA
jgi:hypothetical protein